MFFSDMTLLVVQEQHKDRLHNAQRERLIQEVQQANNQGSPRNIRGWIDALRMRNENLTD